MNVATAETLVSDLKARVRDAESRAYWLTESEERLVFSFHALADSWLALARAVEADPSARYDGGGLKADVLAQMAPRLVGHAQNIEGVFSDAGFGAAVRTFAIQFPAAMRETAMGAVDGVTSVAAAGAYSLALPVAIIAAGAIGLLFLFSKSGAQLSTPFLKVGG